MKPSALLSLLDALLGLVDERLEREPAAGDLPGVGKQVQRLVAILVRLAEAAAAVEVGPIPERISPAMVAAILEARRLRASYFPSHVGGASWILLLTLYRARLEGRRYSVGRLGAEAALAPSTSLRWVHALRDEGLVTWQPDPTDARTTIVELSEAGEAQLDAFLKAALRISPLVL
ncbi:MAG TPA: hypothetical protein VGW34_11055 [Allosphingosinicella sp.]|nr:hypothetical protein [Allosphingosinicella sp.]